MELPDAVTLPAGALLALLAVSALLAGAALTAAVLRARDTRAARDGVHDALVRIEQRLAEAARDGVDRDDRLSAALNAQDRLRREDHAALLQTLERRLAESASARAREEAALRIEVSEGSGAVQRALSEHGERTAQALGTLRTRVERRQVEAARAVHEGLQRGLHALARQLGEALARGSGELQRRVDALTASTDRRLDAIGTQVERRLADGFEKTTQTFQEVRERLALIDEAQARLTELSGNVVSLQELLADKRARGAFGEVQLEALVSELLPAGSYALQHTLGNGRRADCVLFLPPPTGTIAIDAKFPLESYQRMTDVAAPAADRERAARQFRTDVRTHVRHIAERYIVPGETADGALMFVPAEAVFAEIQAHHPEVVQAAQRARVWLASPTTLMAILNTARGVLKDDATRRQVHVIRRHLADLAADFDRFGERMDRLATHIGQANRDVQQVHTSASRIRRRFEAIERVEVDGDDAASLAEPAARSAGSGD